MTTVLLVIRRGPGQYVHFYYYLTYIKNNPYFIGINPIINKDSNELCICVYKFITCD